MLFLFCNKSQAVARIVTSATAGNPCRTALRGRSVEPVLMEMRPAALNDWLDQLETLSILKVTLLIAVTLNITLSTVLQAEFLKLVIIPNPI